MALTHLQHQGTRCLFSSCRLILCMEVWGPLSSAVLAIAELPIRLQPYSRVSPVAFVSMSKSKRSAEKLLPSFQSCLSFHKIGTLQVPLGQSPIRNEEGVWIRQQSRTPWFSLLKASAGLKGIWKHHAVPSFHGELDIPPEVPLLLFPDGQSTWLRYQLVQSSRASKNKHKSKQGGKRKRLGGRPKIIGCRFLVVMCLF